jgi:transposase
VRLLDHVRGKLARVTRRLRRELRRTPLAQLLDSIPGIGLVLAHTLQAEIGLLERFRSQRALASYCLLAPISNDTGEPDPGRPALGRHLGRRGNRTLKWAFIEAAHGAVKKGGKWRAMFDRYTQGGKKNRNRGYIKVARELVKVVYAVWKNQEPYTLTPAPRPGSRRRSRSTRSGTGQPSRPMVAAG